MSLAEKFDTALQASTDADMRVDIFNHYVDSKLMNPQTIAACAKGTIGLFQFNDDSMLEVIATERRLYYTIVDAENNNKYLLYIFSTFFDDEGETVDASVDKYIREKVKEITEKTEQLRKQQNESS